MKRHSLPRIDCLEPRLAPAAFGVPWPAPDRITLSFVPDGTAVGTQRSELFRLLDAAYGSTAWQRVFLRAAQAWTAEANLEIGVVAESSPALPLGAAGAIQGDARFGDIRVGAFPIAPDALAIGN